MRIWLWDEKLVIPLVNGCNWRKGLNLLSPSGDLFLTCRPQCPRALCKLWLPAIEPGPFARPSQTSLQSLNPASCSTKMRGHKFRRTKGSAARTKYGQGANIMLVVDLSRVLLLSNLSWCVNFVAKPPTGLRFYYGPLKGCTCGSGQPGVLHSKLLLLHKSCAEKPSAVALSMKPECQHVQFAQHLPSPFFSGLILTNTGLKHVLDLTCSGV